MSVISLEDLKEGLGQSLANQTLIPDDDANLLVGRLVREGVELPMAQRVLHQTLVFMAASVVAPERSFRPSADVDECWHELITDTEVYMALCQVLGVFIHHVPCDKSGGEPIPLEEVLGVMRSYELPVDESLWQEASKCPESSHPACASTAEPL